jgi:hypothetical protein
MEEQTPDTSAPKKKKTGPKTKLLVEATYTGFEVGRGEKKKVIDPKEVEKLASMGFKRSEIAEYLDVDDSTLSYNFKQELAKGQMNLKQSLRRAMIHNAVINYNATIQIFLAKNILGMSDSPLDSEANAPLPWSDED